MLSRMGNSSCCISQPLCSELVNEDVHALARMVVYNSTFGFSLICTHHAITSFPFQLQSCSGDACVRVCDAEICD